MSTAETTGLVPDLAHDEEVFDRGPLFILSRLKVGVESVAKHERKE